MNTLTTHQVLELATKAHDGQYREDGKPYITHPIAVAEYAMKIFEYNRGYIKHWATELVLGIIYQSALIHDVLEDTDLTAEKLLELGVDQQVVLTAEMLNKNNYNSYADMIQDISVDFIASIVKLADLSHNLKDCGKGSRRDKYELASKYILDALKRSGFCITLPSID